MTTEIRKHDKYIRPIAPRRVERLNAARGQDTAARIARVLAHESVMAAPGALLTLRLDRRPALNQPDEHCGYGYYQKNVNEPAEGV